MTQHKSEQAAGCERRARVPFTPDSLPSFVHQAASTVVHAVWIGAPDSARQGGHTKVFSGGGVHKGG